MCVCVSFVGRYADSPAGTYAPSPGQVNSCISCPPGKHASEPLSVDEPVCVVSVCHSQVPMRTVELRAVPIVPPVYTIRVTVNPFPGVRTVHPARSVMQVTAAVRPAASGSCPGSELRVVPTVSPVTARPVTVRRARCVPSITRRRDPPDRVSRADVLIWCRVPVFTEVTPATVLPDIQETSVKPILMNVLRLRVRISERASIW